MEGTTLVLNWQVLSFGMIKTNCSQRGLHLTPDVLKLIIINLDC